MLVAVAATVGVGLAAAGLGQASADHVSDREQGDVEPDLVGSEVVGAAFLALDGVACE